MSMFKSRNLGLSFLLAALAGVVLVPLAAYADEAWPTNLRARWLFYKSATDNEVLTDHFHGHQGLSNANLAVNWCKAKDTLPSGWDTQDDRRLRTDSMCAEAPMYGHLGSDSAHNWGGGPFTAKSRAWSVPGAQAPGRYIFSINFWNGWVHHHAEGNHTILKLVELKVPPADCIGGHWLTGPGFGHCQK